MERKAGKKPAGTGADERAARLKAALKANLARRKGQAKARASAEDGPAPEDSPQGDVDSGAGEG